MGHGKKYVGALKPKQVDLGYFSNDQETTQMIN